MCQGACIAGWAELGCAWAQGIASVATSHQAREFSPGAAAEHSTHLFFSDTVRQRDIGDSAEHWQDAQLFPAGMPQGARVGTAKCEL